MSNDTFEIAGMEASGKAPTAPKAHSVALSDEMVEVEPGIFLNDFRTDIPSRGPEEIAVLLKYESESQRSKRIDNDKERERNKRFQTAKPSPYVRASSNPQTCIVDPDALVPSLSRWGH